MSDVKIKIEAKIQLNESLQEQFKVKAESISLKGMFPVKVSVDKENIYYLGSESFREEDLDHFTTGRGDSLKLYDESDNVIEKNKEIIYDLLKSSFLTNLNLQINEGQYDDQIKERFKDKKAIKVKLADIQHGRHRASPQNSGKNHNWVPTGEMKDDTIKIPKFYARDNGSGELVGTYDSIHNACVDITGLSTGNVRLCLRGKRKTVEGYTFEFVDPNSEEVLDWLEQAEIDSQV